VIVGRVPDFGNVRRRPSVHVVRFAENGQKPCFCDMPRASVPTAIALYQTMDRLWRSAGHCNQTGKGDGVGQ
jgi:hypothetical protein